MSRHVLTLALALGLGAAASGCMSAELARVRRDVAADLPEARIARGHAPAFGRLSLGLARQFVGTDDPNLHALLGNVRGAAFGRYRVGGAFSAENVTLARALDRARSRGWTPVVVAREDSTVTWVLSRDARDGTLGDLLVMALDHDELTLVRVHGRLDAAALAVAGDGILDDALAGRQHRDDELGDEPPTQ